jgi:hypothetical protein
MIKWCNWVIRIPVLYSGGPRFKSQPEDCLSWFSSVPPCKCQGTYLKLGHDCFLPHTFQKTRISICLWSNHCSKKTQFFCILCHNPMKSVAQQSWWHQYWQLAEGTTVLTGQWTMWQHGIPHSHSFDFINQVVETKWKKQLNLEECQTWDFWQRFISRPQFLKL